MSVSVKIRYMLIGQQIRFDAYKTVEVPFLIDGMSLYPDEYTMLVVRSERLSYYSEENKAYLVCREGRWDDDKNLKIEVERLKKNGWVVE